MPSSPESSGDRVAEPRPVAIEIVEEPIASLAEHAGVPNAFEVDRVLEVVAVDGGWSLTERTVAEPWMKDYDAVIGSAPDEWGSRFDLSSWGLLVARVGGRRAGGAVIAFDTPAVQMLRGERDLAVIWDLRVMPEFRRHGVGRALLMAADAWATTRGCTRLEIETQQINVAACALYARHGCELRSVDPRAYADHPDEIQLIWSKPLGPDARSGDDHTGTAASRGCG